MTSPYRDQAIDQLLDKSRFNALVLNSDVNRDQPLDYSIRICNDRDELNDAVPDAVDDADADWVDDGPLEAIKNNYTLDLEILSLRKREPREDNRKRKLCYSPYADDGYGLSKRTYQRAKRRNRQIRARGKRFRKDDSMIIDGDDDEPIVGSGSQSVDTGSQSGNCLSDGEQSGSYGSDEGTVRDEDEMDEEEEMEANLPDELMNKMENNLNF